MNYERNFINDLFQKEIHLLKKLKNDAKFSWTKKSMKALRSINNEISNVPAVYFPKIEHKLIFEIDISNQ